MDWRKVSVIGAFLILGFVALAAFTCAHGQEPVGRPGPLGLFDWHGYPKVQVPYPSCPWPGTQQAVLNGQIGVSRAVAAVPPAEPETVPTWVYVAGTVSLVVGGLAAVGLGAFAQVRAAGSSNSTRK